jgi:hypothetical protein
MIDIRNIAVKYSPEIALLVLMLRVKLGKADEKTLSDCLAEYSMDYDWLLLLMKEHDLENILHDSIVLEKLAARNPALKPAIVRRARFNLFIFTELISLIQLFRNNSIQFLNYKGILLSKILFNDFTTRNTSDIDILINAGDFLSVRQVLLNAGYEEVYYFPDHYPDYYLLKNREATFRRKGLEGQYIYIEIQWAPLPEMYGLPYDNVYFFKHAEIVRLSGEELPAVRLEQHLILLLIHHGISDLWRNLKHVFDIAVFMEKTGKSLDWQEIFLKVEQWHFQENAGVGLMLAEDLFGVNIPDNRKVFRHKKTSEMALTSVLSYPLLTKKKKNYFNVKRQLLFADNFYEKTKLIKGYLKTAISPSMIDLENIKLPAKLFPFYFLTKRLRFLLPKKK